MVFLINLYQRIKRLLGFPSPCRFYPTCSQYAREAVARHGIIKGTVLGFKRILKCHPGNVGGEDKVPVK